MKFDEYNKVAEKYGVGGGDFMTLQEGDNKIRIVSEFEDFGTHFDQSTKKGAVCTGKENCPYCQKGDKVKVRFLGWVIDRADKQIKMLTIGWKIFQQIGEFAKSNEYGFEKVPGYDMTIRRTGTGLNTVYTVIPARTNTELTMKEQEAIKQKVKSPKDIITRMKEKQEIPTIEE